MEKTKKKKLSRRGKNTILFGVLGLIVVGVLLTPKTKALDIDENQNAEEPNVTVVENPIEENKEDNDDAKNWYDTTKQNWEKEFKAIQSSNSQKVEEWNNREQEAKDEYNSFMETVKNIQQSNEKILKEFQKDYEEMSNEISQGDNDITIDFEEKFNDIQNQINK